MEPKQQNQLSRHLASLKIVSRLLGHELHSQASNKTVTLSRDEVLELQTCIDLYIEEISRRLGMSAGVPSVGVPGNEPAMVTSRIN
jgi:hypothetical protein